MEGNYPMNLSQRGFSREGMRVPSRERNIATPEIRKKATVATSKTTLSVSGQNFFNSSQQLEGISSSTDDLSLATLNIAVDETAFISTAKVDILQLQEEINKMDNDGRIRNTNTSNILKKNHTYAMAKFLSKFSNLNIKNLIDKRLQHSSSFDTDDLLKFMGVRSESEGLRKLFKVLGIFDLMVLKLTEFHTVAFMKYEQVFESLRKQLGGQPSTKTAGMDSGINLSRFQVDLANMERLFELFSFVGKLSQQNRSSESRTGGSRTQIDERPNPLANLSSIEDLYTSLKNGENLGFNAELNENLTSLIEKSLEFRVKENSLEKKIRSLERELKEQSTKLSTMVEISAGSDKGDTEREYQEKLEELQRENENIRKELEAKFNKDLRSRESELKEKVRKMEYELEVKGDDISKLQGEIEKLKLAAQNQAQAQPAPVKEAAKDDVYNTEYYLKMIKQIEDNYAARSKDVESDNHKKDQEIFNLKIKIETFESEKDDYKQRLLIAENQLEKDARLRLKGEDASFEAALREQFAAMKEGFEMKIKNLMSEIQTVKKEKSLEILETKRDLQREKEGRELLLRKLQIYTKN